MSNEKVDIICTIWRFETLFEMNSWKQSWFSLVGLHLFLTSCAGVALKQAFWFCGRAVSRARGPRAGKPDKEMTLIESGCFCATVVMQYR